MNSYQQKRQFSDPEEFISNREIDFISRLNYAVAFIQKLAMHPVTKSSEYLRAIKVLKIMMRPIWRDNPDFEVKEKTIIEEIQKKYNQRFKEINAPSLNQLNKEKQTLSEQELFEQGDKLFEYYWDILQDNDLITENKVVNLEE